MGNGAELSGNNQVQMEESMREESRERLWAAVQFVFPFVVLGILWEMSVRLGYISAQILPAPSMIFQ